MTIRQDTEKGPTSDRHPGMPKWSLYMDAKGRTDQYRMQGPLYAHIWRPLREFLLFFRGCTCSQVLAAGSTCFFCFKRSLKRSRNKTGMWPFKTEIAHLQLKQSVRSDANSSEDLCCWWFARFFRCCNFISTYRILIWIAFTSCYLITSYDCFCFISFVGFFLCCCLFWLFFVVFAVCFLCLLLQKIKKVKSKQKQNN